MINTTAIGFTLLAAGLTFCGIWFLLAFKKSEQKNNGKIGFLLTLMFLGYGVQNGWMGFGMWLFALSPEGLFWTMIIDNIILTLEVMLAIYIAYYIFSPQLSSRIAISLAGLLGATLLVAMFIVHPLPFLTANNSIDLNMNPLLSFLTFYLLFINIGAALYIFGRLFFVSPSRSVKALSLLQCVLAIIGIINVFVFLVLKHFQTTEPGSLSFGYVSGGIGIVFIFALIIIPFLKTTRRSY